MKFARFLHVYLGFLQVLWILEVCTEVNWCVYIVPVRASVGVGVSVPCDGKVSCPGWGPAWRPELPG